VKWNDIHRHFLADPPKPVGGKLAPHGEPGFEMDPDPAKIEAEQEVFAAV